MDRISVINNNGVHLVVPESRDIDMWYKGINDIEIQQYLSIFGMPISKESEEGFYNSLNKDGNKITFCIYIEELNQVIGNVGFFNKDEISRNAELGVVIFDTKNHNKGYGTEAINLFLKYAFEIIGLNKIVLRYIGNNTRGKKVYERIGFKEVGRYKDHNYRFGKYHDEVFMEIFAKDYLKK